ncbi:MAG: OmpA family protein [Verrucomicrobia bacterium]|nr:OmpA family protein [Verrucomicrobiota bacterium]
MKPQFGVCKNKVGCSLAYTGEKIPLTSGANCPECGQPLSVQTEGNQNRNLFVVAVLLVLGLLIIGAGAIFLFEHQITNLAFHPSAVIPPNPVQSSPAVSPSATTKIADSEIAPVPLKPSQPSEKSPSTAMPSPSANQALSPTTVPAPTPSNSTQIARASTPQPFPALPSPPPSAEPQPSAAATPQVLAPRLQSQAEANSSQQDEQPSLNTDAQQPPATVPTPSNVREDRAVPDTAATPTIQLADKLSEQEIDQTRTEVLKRIDAMPKFTAEDKRRLAAKMQTARYMQRLLVIHFELGQSSLSPTAINELVNRFRSREIDQKTSDPTVVFVVAGYADTTGDPKKNIQLSEQRADFVTKILKDKANVLNVIHSIGMGETDLLDKKRTDQNRAVEIWAVAP